MIKSFFLKIPLMDFQSYNSLKTEKWEELLANYAKSIHLQLWQQDFQGIDGPCSLVYVLNFATRPQNGLNMFFIMVFMLSQHILSISDEKSLVRGKSGHTGAFVHNISYRFGDKVVTEDIVEVLIHSVK